MKKYLTWYIRNAKFWGIGKSKEFMQAMRIEL